jgi:hypothetical protein
MKIILGAIVVGFLGLVVFVTFSIKEVRPDEEEFQTGAQVGALAGYLRLYHGAGHGRATSLREVVMMNRRAGHASLPPAQRDWQPDVLTPDEERIFTDVWGRSITFDYETLGVSYAWVTVRSAGADGMPHTPDDILERFLVLEK